MNRRAVSMGLELDGPRSLGLLVIFRRVPRLSGTDEARARRFCESRRGDRADPARTAFVPRPIATKQALLSGKRSRRETLASLADWPRSAPCSCGGARPTPVVRPTIGVRGRTLDTGAKMGTSKRYAERVDRQIGERATFAGARRHRWPTLSWSWTCSRSRRPRSRTRCALGCVTAGWPSK